MRGNCGSCVFMHEHEQLGGEGAWCHAEPPTLALMHGGNRVVHGKPELQGINQMGLWPPVDKVGGWCGRYEMVGAHQ